MDIKLLNKLIDVLEGGRVPVYTYVELSDGTQEIRGGYFISRLFINNRRTYCIKRHWLTSKTYTTQVEELNKYYIDYKWGNLGKLTISQLTRLIKG